MSKSPKRSASSKSKARTRGRSQQNSQPTASSHSSLRRVAVKLIQLVLIIVVVVGVVLLVQYAERRQTEQAIAQLQGLSNSDHGDNLAEVIANVQADMPGTEIIFVFDEDGNKLIERDSHSPYGVDLPSQATAALQKLRHLTHMHTHPLYDSGFSDMDLGMLQRTELDKAVTTMGVITPRRVFYLDCNQQPWMADADVAAFFLKLKFELGDDVDPIAAGILGTTVVNGQDLYYITDSSLRRLADEHGYRLRIETP